MRGRARAEMQGRPRTRPPTDQTEHTEEKPWKTRGGKNRKSGVKGKARKKTIWRLSLLPRKSFLKEITQHVKRRGGKTESQEERELVNHGHRPGRNRLNHASKRISITSELKTSKVGKKGGQGTNDKGGRVIRRKESEKS